MLDWLESDFISIKEKSGSDNVVFVFSHIDTKRGSFSFWKVCQSIPANLVFVNSGSNNWFHHGIEGLTSSIPETAAVLAEIARYLGCKNIYTFGASMGGYAAALFACLLKAQRCLMLSTETVLMLNGSRSEHFVSETLDPGYVNINPLIQGSYDTKFIIWTGEEEPVDMVCIDRLMPADNTNVHVIPVCGHFAAKWMHDNGLLSLALRSLLSSGFESKKLKLYEGYHPKLNIELVYFYLSEYLASTEKTIEARYNKVKNAIEDKFVLAADRVAYHHTMARMFYHRSNFAASAVASTAAVFADQTRWEGYLCLSVALARQDKIVKAKRALRHALERGYHSDIDSQALLAMVAT